MTTHLHRRAFLLGLGAIAATPLHAQRGGRTAAMLIAAARRQVGVTLHYDPAYTSLAFPNGDVARSKGVCTDVLIRAYRDAFGIDLQTLVNADMRAAFSAYPTRWALRRPDRNIDHRRVPNLQTLMTRKGARLPLPTSPQGWRPGDIFTSLIDDRLPHTGIVSDRRGRSGNWAVIHNIGAGAREEDALFAYKLTGHYRFMLDG
ncbi:DUF1287 domain-containing protein [Sphingomonas sp. So64.6b]|uniref:DUF1287 domain-containing protein n=1 Tax=Sphingomonas sp. So64.6b TaxID=2997354 RepID=UPI001603605F|nr:DUF1287 domain-containing protein [Sphingomonas sp. So64.6b]QNA83047.1 DUF1287 domain-containing protein [Sphingomonas sp. So64.6b]